ncbi:MAG TPA: type II toxin-antitoxin system RelE/ParE family toxin [Sphingomicrobium sp.]|nr:type II toxin-antitoxin system RelE/ParE family toxin [Sphingomicrobium sp.]
MDADKELIWIGSSKEDLSAFPDDVKLVMGFALRVAQQGGKHPSAKPLKGYKGAGVLEIVDDFDGDTYRAVYTVRFESAVYALGAFQKKSKKGIATSKADLDRIKGRLKRAEDMHAEWLKEREGNGKAKG